MLSANAILRKIFLRKAICMNTSRIIKNRFQQNIKKARAATRALSSYMSFYKKKSYHRNEEEKWKRDFNKISRKTLIKVTDDSISIIRKGFINLVNQGIKEKTIPFKNISAVQLKTRYEWLYTLPC